MVYALHRGAVFAAAGFVIALMASGCGGGSQIPGSVAGGAAQSRAFTLPAPAPASTEFTAGITPNSEPRGITRGFSGMWFTQPGSNQIGHISLQGAIAEFKARSEERRVG